MAKHKNRYLVETQARDGTWCPCRPSKQQVYANCTRPWFIENANYAITFMDEVIRYAIARSIGIRGVRIIQIDPNNRENVYHAKQLEGAIK